MVDIKDGVLLFSNRHRNKALRALVVELVDTRDLKSLGVRAVPVQVRPGAPSILPRLEENGSLTNYHISDYGALAEWLCSGLQIRGPRFDSGRRLQILGY